MLTRLVVVVAMLFGVLTTSGTLTAGAATTLPRVSVSGSSLIVNGGAFTGRGYNFVRLAKDSTGVEFHSTFEPGLWDEAAAQAAIGQWSADGLDYVRVFVDPGSWSTPRGIGGGVDTAVPAIDRKPFSDAYMGNVARFVALANEKSVYVVPVLSDIPVNCFFYAFLCDHTAPAAVNVADVNTFWMDPNFVAAKAEYVRLFTLDVKARLGTTTGLLAVESDNEAQYNASQPPFDKRSGTVKGSNGKTYDMASLPSRQAAADESFAFYVSKVRTALRKADPVLLMVGQFTNFAVGKTSYDGLSFCSGPAPCKPHTDYRVPVRLSRALPDVVDFHAYPRNPGTGYTLAADLKTGEQDKVITRPWVLGEFGAFREFFPTVTEAADNASVTRVAACKLGSKLYGYWTWDTTFELDGSSEMQRMYTGRQDGGAINGKFAPVAEPYDCSAPAKRR